MNNIFSIFDPMNSMNYSLNWFSMLIFCLIISNNFWMSNNRLFNMWMLIINFLKVEMNIILKKKIHFLIFFSLFIFILMINFMGLFPYIFTNSSHMTFSLSLSLPMWLGFMLIGWINNTKHMLMHQVPMGTPSLPLMIFMVLIEFISNIIRPITLSIRLTANMIAGHLLITLISNNGALINIPNKILLIIVQSLLMILEMSVSLIQAYVFVILLSLYSKEIY